MIGHAVRLVLAVAILAWTAGAPMAQRRPPSGFVSDALADLVLNKYRPIPNFERFHDWLGDPKQRQDIELEDDLKDLARWREREGKNWQALEAARRANLARAPFDKVIAIARMMVFTGERQSAIVGRAEPPKPPPPVADKGELAAFGLWPKSPLSVSVGDTFALDAMGVYLDDPFEAVKLNDKVTWEPGAGVTRSPSGDFRAAAPGRYQVKVTIRRKGAGIMSDPIDVIVGP